MISMECGRFVAMDDGVWLDDVGLVDMSGLHCIKKLYILVENQLVPESN